LRFHLECAFRGCVGAIISFMRFSLEKKRYAQPYYERELPV